MAAIVLALVLTGCQVTTSVAVRVGHGGSGQVTVAVSFDRAARAAVGGVRSQLRDSDLLAAGWTEATTSGPDGSTVVTIVHGFSHPWQIPGLLAELGRSPDGRHLPLFRLEVHQTSTFFHTTTTATGRVDLSCGLDCFADPGLQRDYGSAFGVDAGTLAGPHGAAVAARTFRFAFGLTVAGRVISTDASSRHPSLRWTPALGRSTPLAVTATAIDSRHVAETTAASGLTIAGLAVVILIVVIGLRRRRRSRAGGRHLRET
jgi:hypothetical protein